MKSDPDTARRLEQHVRRLAEDIGERNVYRPQALQAAQRAVPRALFAEILRRIERLRPRPPPLPA